MDKWQTKLTGTPSKVSRRTVILRANPIKAAKINGRTTQIRARTGIEKILRRESIRTIEKTAKDPTTSRSAALLNVARDLKNFPTGPFCGSQASGVFLLAFLVVRERACFRCSAPPREVNRGVFCYIISIEIPVGDGSAVPFDCGGACSSLVL